jgi:4-amino-4-deoxy-L-arabinose transferase-like glycosyltransferase
VARFHFALSGAALLIAGTLLAYSQTFAFAWDEGFHLLAAQLIAGGKRPYLDFFFPQTPLNAYWNGAWMLILGQSWRVPHAIAALEVFGAVVLACETVYRCLPELRWRLPATLFVASAFGLNVAVVQFGPTAQAYGLCLFLIVAAFRASIAAVSRPSALLGFLAGFLSTAAAASSLLTAPVAPVLFIWMLAVSRAGSRISRLAAFVLGALIACIPLLWLFALSPYQVMFGVFQFHMFHREVEWSGALSHNLEVAMTWIDLGQALALILLAALGLLFVRRSNWEQSNKRAFYLCGWLALAETVHLLTARPTFSRYFLFTVPFLAIPAAAGLCACGERLSPTGRVRAAVAAGCCLMALGLAKRLYEGRDDLAWHDVEAIAAKVIEVTPPGAPLYAEESIYFLTHRTPMTGLEYHDSHKLKLPPAEAAALHVIPRPELDRMIMAGVFSTVQSCSDDEVDRLAVEKLYAKKADIADCVVFWGRK